MLQATHDTYTQRAAALALAPLCCAASDAMLKPDAVLILLRLLCDRSPTATETRVAALALFASLREACAGDAHFWKAIDALPNRTGRLTLLRGVSAMLMSSPLPAASVLATFPLPKEGAAAPPSETDAKSAQHCVVAVAALLARPPTLSPRRAATPGKSGDGGGAEEEDVAATLTRLTLRALVRLAATASDASSALLEEPMALPALVDALTGGGGGGQRTATLPFPAEVRTAMLQLLADALVASAGEGSGGSFGDVHHWDVVRMLLVNKQLLPTLVASVDVPANRLAALRCFSALAAGDASARRAVAACDDLLAVLVSAMQPQAPAAAAAPPARAPTGAVAAGALVALVATVEACDGGGGQDGAAEAVAAVVGGGQDGAAEAVAAVVTAVVADAVVEGGADVAAESTAPPPSYSSPPSVRTP